jgi:integrase
MTQHIKFDNNLSGSKRAERFALKLRALAVQCADRRLDNNRQASIKTRDDAIKYSYRVGHLLWGLGYQIEKPENLTQKHIDALMTYIWSQNKCAGTFSVWVTQLRKLVHFLKLQIAVDSKRSVPEAEIHLLKRKTSASKSKSITGNNIDLKAILKKAHEIDARFGVMAELEYQFGLRRTEVLSLIPHPDDHGLYLNIRPNKGKGSLPRTIPIRTPDQRRALDHAKTLVGLNEHLGWPPVKADKRGPLMKINEQKYNYLMRKLGLTKKQLGVTGHSLRAEFAEQTAIALGYTPPTLGGIRGELQKEEEQFVRRQVAQAMGHSRVSVTSVYYGSHRSVGKQDRNPLI